jgi:hypothetical protein
VIWELSQGAGVDMIAPGWLKYRGLNEKALWREIEPPMAGAKT